MNPSSVFFKTEKGRSALKPQAGAQPIPVRTRGVLIMVDGKATANELIRKMSIFPDTEQQILWLLHNGYIADTPGAVSSAPATPAAAAQAAPAASQGAAAALSPAVRKVLEEEVIELTGPMGMLLCDEACASASDLNGALQFLGTQLSADQIRTLMQALKRRL